MPDSNTLRHEAPEVSLRMEEISKRTTIWPKAGAILDIEPQDGRASFGDWAIWAGEEIVAEKAKLHEFREEDENFDCARLHSLWAINSVVQLPLEVVAAARKRLFGAMPPRNTKEEWLFSWFELHLITAAFWQNAPARSDYLRLVREAEAKAQQAKEVNSIFDELRSELA